MHPVERALQKPLLGNSSHFPPGHPSSEYFLFLGTVSLAVMIILDPLSSLQSRPLTARLRSWSVSLDSVNCLWTGCDIIETFLGSEVGGVRGMLRILYRICVD